MEIRLTPDQEDHIAAFRAALDAAEESIAQGRGRPITRESLRDLAAGVKRRGRAHAAER